MITQALEPKTSLEILLVELAAEVDVPDDPTQWQVFNHVVVAAFFAGRRDALSELGRACGIQVKGGK